jgi:hypothetical protein
LGDSYLFNYKTNLKIFYTPNKSESIYHYATSLLGLPITDSTTLARADFVLSANVWYNNLNEWIWKSQNTWQFDDTNYDELPEAATDIVADQQMYTLPTSVFDIRKVEILDSNGNPVLLKPLTDVSDAEMLDYTTSGLPIYYSLKANVIKLYPAPSADQTTLTDGLIISVARDIDKFTITDTNKEPGIPTQFHDIIAYGVVRDKSVSYGMPELFMKMERLLQTKRAELEGHFSKRHRDVKRRIIPSTSSSI